MVNDEDKGLEDIIPSLNRELKKLYEEEEEKSKNMIRPLNKILEGSNKGYFPTKLEKHGNYSTSKAASQDLYEALNNHLKKRFDEIVKGKGQNPPSYTNEEHLTRRESSKIYLPILLWKSPKTDHPKYFALLAASLFAEVPSKDNKERMEYWINVAQAHSEMPIAKSVVNYIKGKYEKAEQVMKNLRKYLQEKEEPDELLPLSHFKKGI